MRTRLLTAAAAVIGLALSGTASAAVMVLGGGPERSCYEAAKKQRPNMAALQMCNDALENVTLSSRDRAATYVNRSVLYLVRNSAVAALADTNSAMRIDPALTAAAVNRAAALLLLERYAEARSTIDAALPLASGPDLQRALFNRAMASESMGDVQSAYKDLHRALEIDPQFQEARIEIARYEVRHGH